MIMGRDTLERVDELVYLRLGPEPVEYHAAWDLQRRIHARRKADEIPDTCLLLEHEPTYTAGKRTATSDRPAGEVGAPVIDVDRGGKITWHGPGQLTGYPVIKLREPLDVIAYVRALEEAMIRTCADYGIVAQRVEGRSGAWIAAAEGPGQSGAVLEGGPGGRIPPAKPARKVGAIGARVARGVTMHGFALNCDCDLSWFDRIIACGIRDATVTSLSEETGRRITVAEVTPLIERHLADALCLSPRQGHAGAWPAWAPRRELPPLRDGNRRGSLRGLGLNLKPPRPAA
jgi:lipoyl(octanoyl) transferase